MNTLYMNHYPDLGSPMSFANMPDLMPSKFDDATTDPSPSPPVTNYSVDNQYNTYTNTSYPEYFQPQPTIINSIEFTDLTQIQSEDRQRRRSDTSRDKEAASNMRIRRRAQNRASQRAFRERKEKHVQHLEHELEELEAKHQHLTKSYTDLDSTHGKLKREVKQLRLELETMKTIQEHPIDKRLVNQQFDPFATDSFLGNAPGRRF